MVVGTGNETTGKVLLFSSEDLLSWEYSGVLFEGPEYANCIECPDFFKLGDDYVLMFSKIGETEQSTIFVVGDFENGRLVNHTISRPEWGPDFYAPQTFEAPDGRRIMLGWMYHWGKTAPEGCPFAGALSSARVLSVENRAVRSVPAEEVQHFLKKESKYVIFREDGLLLLDNHRSIFRHVSELRSIDILEDTKALEVFVNKGEQVFSWWLE